MAVATSTALLAGAAASGGAAYLDRKSNKDAVKSAERQKQQSQEFIERQIKQARADIFKLFPAAQESRQKGLDAGLHLYSQAYPAMMNSFQQGNVGAQQALIAGLPQMQNAIMGDPVNMNFKPVQLQQPQGLTLPQQRVQPINELGLGNV